MSDKKPERRGLGRGLSALMADVNLAPTALAQSEAGGRRGEMLVPVEKLEPNPEQPRRDFVPEALEELAASLREKGIIQPLIVRKHPTKPDHFEIVAGERRWRAAQLAQLHDLPVVVRDLTDSEVLEVAIIENIQRADLNPVEEAMGYRQLMERFGHTQEKLAEALSKSRSHIANLMRLLQLPAEVQGWLREGKLTAGHARALITTADPAALAREVMARGLSVRETEQLAKGPRKAAAPGGASQPRRAEKDADTRVLENDLSAHLGMRVVIDHKGMDGGMLTITYRSLDQLDELCQILSAMR
ncbi:chromosome partitioning protein ParB [Rhodobacter veldkampii DSM 11550]|uniref:Chromosome partitioning protein ParB n=1 Tax=Phaeovulum veldkampii DSM 11550 TaxID=1185920 RepID=A0A2T4JJH0_9RHOB|nr:ParB/RepB/Spo0J family partition protein [Phaeovulum veldkampii]MBK5947271.1 chromosome partitioning protein ParB [Phaeovulum veldkampii DSM 11550]PTE17927.1 chromosome partitioning protein ParB [Phaeovulum veldkampii DSM 11550]TDQ56723.1 chromosome segregation DNA-binding protein [Phaeovulum veldkampii DSM 11550]